MDAIVKMAMAMAELMPAKKIFSAHRKGWAIQRIKNQPYFGAKAESNVIAFRRPYPYGGE